MPYIQNYSPTDYNAASQNWAVVQNKEGFIYVGNNNGVLEYDGVSWRLIELPNYGIARALAIASNNRIYVGGYNELGYLEPDEQGLLQFISLKENLEEKNFQLVGDISIQNESIYFTAEKKIFEWKNNSFSVHDSSSGFNFSKKIGNEIYAVENNLKLKKIDANGFKEVIDASKIGAKVITDVSTHDKNKLLILTYTKGIFVLENGKIQTLNVKTSNFLSKSLARRIIKLSNGNYAIGTVRNGIITIDRDGNIIQAVNKDLGLQDDTIFRLFEDNQKGVWAATNYGISRVELSSPYSIFDERQGIEGYVNDIVVIDGKLYLANYNGVLRLGNHESIENHSYFENISPLVSSTGTSSKQAIEFLMSNDTLFVGTRAGLYIYVDHKLEQQIKLKSGALFRSKKNPNRIYVGLADGLASIVYNNGKWENDGRIGGIDDDIRKIIEDTDGNLWLESQVDGVWKIEAGSLRNSDSFHNPKVKHFKSNQELPDGVLFLRSINNKVLFNIDNDIYAYDKKQDSIIKDSSIAQLFKLPGEISVKLEDKDGHVWMFAQLQKEDERRSRIKAINEGNGTYRIQKNADERITQELGVAHFPEANDVVWYGGSGGVIRHDLTIVGNEKLDFNSHIRKVTIQNDSMLYGGAGEAKRNTSIPFQGNAFRFEYSATSFDNESENQFQYILEGFDEDWSSWTSETMKDYTNIPEGEYSFKVRSKNVFNHLGNEDSFYFAVLPPWHRTWWAYLIYVVGAIALVSLLLQWRSKELKRKNENLENLIADRTTEIRHKNELLNHQTEQLEQLNESKSRLYSNITHEFRTPLTVIIGMAETLKTNVLNKQFEGAEKSLNMIRRNGKNLLHMVNELLDLSKVESGSMELNLVQTDAIPFVKYLSESFHSLAESKNINLTVYSEINALEMDIDVNKMASIISNLLSNAIKFTKAYGKIIVHLNKIKTKDGELFSIKVQDNGLGLAENDIAHLFDRFYQVDNELSSKQEGTGIGLSLVKEFVELMKGTITVESALGKGSTFTVQIPVTNNAVQILDAKITDEPPVKKTAPNTKVESSFFDEVSTLPLALIIEDNEDVAHYLKTCLKGKYQTLHAINGDKGIEMAYEKIPDIIISDVMMPGKDGFEVCATLKGDERTDHIPIILLTAKVTAEDRLTGLSQGADAYLAKPFNEKELFIRLDQLLLLRKKLVDKIQKDGLYNFLGKQEENPETKFLQKIIQVIREDIGNADFGAKNLADKLHLSESQIYRKLKAITNKSTAVFIRSIRLQIAKDLIQSTNKTISEVAYETGFNDPSWFSRAFKEEFGITPSEVSK
ncbi:ATP-binding protein [Muriicola sp. Z0-33]|uniref:ATP-binding protein n=1 Tax=Muriicola sp. Z0-33 TaxID=2816957 RepID=UPI0022388BBB|nr:ATP-binding protein [Muriicola sp. Z0-33]MCW5515426.1 response regulator [Muriicola sp. Z0-33]